MTLGALLVALALAADPRAALEAVKARKAAEEAAARALAVREGSLLGAVDVVEQALLESEGVARAAEAQRSAAEARLAQARAEEADADVRLARLAEELRPRLASRARLGRTSELRLLASSRSVADLARRHYLWEAVAAHDLALLRLAAAARRDREGSRAQGEEEAARLDGLVRQADAARRDAAARREEHRTLLAAIRSARSLHEQAAAEAASQEADLAEFVATLPPPATPIHTGFPLLKGSLPPPAQGAVEARFGRVVDPRWKTVTVQKGLDIRAPAGAEVRAIAPGRVAHAGWFKGYGNLVIVDHGDGYHTLVAHLATIGAAMGEEVQAGSPLGRVGDTGSLKGAYLYFEVRERGRPVDPQTWLRP